MSVTEQDPRVGTRIREYEILEVIGKGGMGSVYRARHIFLREERAIKVIQGRFAKDPAFLERFVREARVLTRLHHPNLVRFYEFGAMDAEGAFIVMELIRGPSVLDLLRSQGLVAPGAAVRITRQAALGMHSAHEKGIVHRDIAPDNLLLVSHPDGSETVKVIDFGIAKPLFESQSGAVTDTFVGKTEYCSPEQCGLLEEGEIIDRRSDIYSLGVTLYQMLCGKLPFTASTPQGYLLKHASEAPRPVSAHFPEGAVPAELDRLVMSMLAKRRDDRPATMADVIRVLDALEFPGRSGLSEVVPIASSALLKIGDLFARRYLVEQEIGRGGMGTVYRARDTFLDAIVALKVIDPALAADRGALDRLKREVLIARKIQHPGVCRIFDLGEHAGTHYISMEHLEGRTLASILARDGLITPEIGLPILQQVMQALEYLHEAGVIHRDVKPENIMIDNRGKATLMDFGISISADSRPVTQADARMGTKAYIAPERLRNDAADPRGDIYSIGVVLYETLTGRLPADPSTGGKVAASSLNPGLPAQLDSMLAKALETDPGRRYRDMHEMLAELKPLVPAGTGVLPANRPPVVRRILVAAALVSLLLYAGLHSRQPSPAPARPAAPTIAVTINALPWARVRIIPETIEGSMPTFAEEDLITPVAIAIPAGRYRLELSNDSLSPALQQRLTVAAGRTNRFVYTMPGFDPRRIAEETEAQP